MDARKDELVSNRFALQSLDKIATSRQIRVCLHGQGSPEEDKWPQSDSNDDDGTDLNNGLGHGNHTTEIHEQFQQN